MSFFKSNTVMGKLINEIKNAIKDFNNNHTCSKYHISQWKLRNDFAGNQRIALAIRKGKENLAEQSEGTACGEDEFAHLYV